MRGGEAERLRNRRRNLVLRAEQVPHRAIGSHRMDNFTRPNIDDARGDPDEGTHMLHGADDQPCGATLLKGLTKRWVVGGVGVGGRSRATQAGQHTRHRVLPQQRQTKLAQIGRHPCRDTGADPLMIRVRAPAGKGHNGDDPFEPHSWLVVDLTSDLTSNLTSGLHVGAVWEGAQKRTHNDKDSHPMPPSPNTRSINQNAPATMTTTEPAYATRRAITWLRAHSAITADATTSTTAS